MRTKAFLWTLLGCLAAPPIATAQDVYFSMGNEIQKLTLPATSTTLVHTSDRPVGDLALCAGDPDSTPISPGRQYLYFVERASEGDDRISRLDVNTDADDGENPTAQTVFTVPSLNGTVGEVRLTHACNVLFATSVGVFQVSGAIPFSTSPETKASADSSGLAVAFDGSIRFSDDNVVSSLTGFTATADGAIVGLGVANGGDGSAVVPPLSPGAVCASTSNKLLCWTKAAVAFAAAFAEFEVSESSAGSAQYFEFLTNDVAIAATSFDPTATIEGTFNGILWKVDSSGPAELFRAPNVGTEEVPLFAPIVGVAVGPSNSALFTPDAAGTTHLVQFGPVAVDVVTTESCSPTFQLRQLSWKDALEKLTSVIDNPNTYLLDPGFGGESWIDVVTITDNVEDECGPSRVALSQFNDALANKALLHCDGTDAEPVCNAITLSNYPFTSPTDPRDSGTEDDFSDFLTAKTAFVAGGENQILFMNPLDNRAAFQSATIDSAKIPFATTHHGGLSVRFQICTGTDCTKFLPGEAPVGSISGATLSITALNPAGIAVADCEIDDNGDSAPDVPLFRVGGKVHNFNLRTPLLGPPACQLTDLAKGESRLFVASISSLSGRFNKTFILFRLSR